MPMDTSGLKAKMKATIYNGLKAQFGGAVGQGTNYTPVADAQWQAMAEAISGIAADIVMEIVSNGQVMPGIPTSDGASTTAPGKIS